MSFYFRFLVSIYIFYNYLGMVGVLWEASSAYSGTAPGYRHRWWYGLILGWPVGILHVPHLCSILIFIRYIVFLFFAVCASVLESLSIFTVLGSLSPIFLMFVLRPTFSVSVHHVRHFSYYISKYWTLSCEVSSVIVRY